MIDEILERVGLKYEDLNTAEKETLANWMQSLQQHTLNIDNIKEYVGSMKDSVEQELSEIGHNSKQDIFLKARLRNYMLLMAFLSSPEKAKAALDKALAGLVANKK